ncbi:MAG TPA: AraC family transcriptional regulator [Candidatus Methylacidiphilales bacterium]
MEKGQSPFWEAAGEIRLAMVHRHTERRAFHWHAHGFYELGLVLSGSCAWRLGTRSGSRARAGVPGGGAILIPPGVWHGERVGKEEGAARLAWVGFSSAAPPPAWSRHPVVLGEDAAEAAQAAVAIYREHGRPGSEARVRLALQTLLLLVSRQAERPPARRPVAGEKNRSARPGRLNPSQAARVEAAAQTLRRNRLSIAQAAAFHSFSPAHFSTLFRRHFGTAPRAFVRGVRLERAERLLASSALSVKEIAAEAGFADSAHFCKAFRGRYGLPPLAFRARQARRPELSPPSA